MTHTITVPGPHEYDIEVSQQYQWQIGAYTAGPAGPPGPPGSDGADGEPGPQGPPGPVEGFSPADHGYAGWAYDGAYPAANTVLPTPGQLVMIRIRLAVARTVDAGQIYIAVAGSGLIAGQCFAALYDAAKNLIDQSSDQATAWASTGVKRLAWSGGPRPLPAGDYYLGVWFNGTTGPALARAGTWGALANAYTGNDVRFGTANLGLTTTAPASIGALTQALPYWAALSSPDLAKEEINS